MEAESRITRLERKSRILTGCLILVSCLGVGIAAAPNIQRFDSLVVSDKILVGPLDGSRPTVVLQSEQGHAAFSIIDKNNKPRIGASFTEGGELVFSAFDKNGKERFSLLITDKAGEVSEDQTELAVHDEHGNVAAAMSTRGSMRTILLKDGRGKERWGAAASGDQVRQIR